MRLGTPKAPLDKIAVGERFRKELGDTEALAESIREVGLLQPIVVDGDYRLIAGLRRLEACRSLGWKQIPIHVVPLKDLVMGELHENMARKDFTVSELVAIKREVEKTRIGHRPGKDEEKVFKLNTFPKGPTLNVLAKFTGRSVGTLHKAEKIVEAAESDPDVFGDILRDVDSGKTSVHHAYTKVKRRQKHENPPPLPKGVFDVIYADPPWPYYLPLRGAPDAHYKTMSIEDIYHLEVEGVSIQEKIADNSILFLWATNPQLKVALKVIEAWDYSYLTNLVWAKDKWGTGHYFRGQHELLLVGKRGKIPPPVEEVRSSSLLYAHVREHSRKPDQVYGIIETLYPNRRYLELFARNNRKGWTSWGLETIPLTQNDQNQRGNYLDYGTISGGEVA